MNDRERALCNDTPPSGRVSALQRLQQLPALFSGKDLTVRFQWTSKTASHYLWLWKSRRLIDAFGGKSDVFANLLTAPKVDWDAALRLAMPGAVIVGVEALRRAGWTTQIALRPQAAVRQSLTLYGTDRFELSPRSDAWFDRVHAASAGGVLAPAWALADLCSTDGLSACGLAPDDIELHDASRGDARQWRAASKAFNLPATALEVALVDRMCPADQTRMRG